MDVSDELKRTVWEKARVVDGFNSDMYRKDACGAWIVWNKFGVQDNAYGWEIDHIYPMSRLVTAGFSEEEIWDVRNLRPLQHQNNASKRDDYPSYTAVVTSDGNKNVTREKNLIVNVKVREVLAEMYHL